ncbi:MAG: DEAD/DEAH box helicase family protein [Nitrosopumilaceae archaeon]|nr:DEAD/DEAH box helicase family protein [Nitrosopumilaceae archaeon]
MSLLDNFPSNLQARDAQKKILDEIQQNLKSGYKKIILSAPTGIGKSAIAMTLAKSYEKSFVVTFSKNLQDQYIGDFEILVPVKGKSNFPCFKTMEQKGIDLQEYDVAMRQGLSCDKGECEERTKEGKRQNCKFKPRIQAFQEKTFQEIICPYYEQKYSALLADHSVWNYHSYFQTVKYNRGTYGEYLNRNISVFDEAHSIEDQIIQFVGIEIIKKHIDECEIRIEAYDLSDIAVIIHLLRDIAEFYARKAKEIRESKTYQEKPDYNLISKIDSDYERFARIRSEIASDPENFIINEPEYKKGKFKSIAIKPLDVSKYVKEFFITPFQIFMSATINKDSFCQNMGFEPEEIVFVDTPHSPFPLENRKVEFLNTARLAFNSPIVNENRVWLKIDEILSKHQNQKGLILTSSRDRCKKIVKNLSSKNKNRIRICHARNPDGKTQDDVIKEHANSKDGVLVSSSLWQGVDLKNDLSRFQIIAKSPYPNYTEKWVESKMERYPLWYSSQTITKILQGFGRSIRSKQDWAVTYVLDSAVEPLLNNSKNLVPKSYYDVFGWDE